MPSRESAGKSRPLTRRQLLQAGGMSLWLGVRPRLGFSADRRMEANRSSVLPESTVPGFGRAKSVILIFASGGQSQLETWDPKPDAPAEIRGEFAAIPTSVPGTFLGEHLPRLARLADRYTIVRSMSHDDLDHGSAFYLSMTGHYHRRLSSNFPPDPNDHPTHASILHRVRPSRQFVHSGVHLNGPAQVPVIVGPGQFGGFLGHEYDPFVIGDVTDQKIVVPGLAPRPDVPAARLQQRQELRSALEAELRGAEQNQRLLDMDTLYRQAFEMLDQKATREAFDLHSEPEELRRRYGLNRSGQACLLARRLAEAGVPLITVIWNHTNRGQDLAPDETDQYGWDTHNDIFSALRDRLLPRFDLSFSALLEDLDSRGMLEDTLVVCLGEFGRAPLVALERRFAGSSPGRKHWSSVYSIVMAGAGVQRGRVLGRSDRHAGYPVSESYGPWDVQATIFSALGIDPASHYTDHTGRPFPISTGRVMTELYAS